MSPNRYRAFLWAVPIIAFGWPFAAFVSPSGRSPFADYLGVGLFLGTLFGQVTLASGWTAFGPGQLIWRLPVALVWLAVLCFAMWLNVGVHGGPSTAFILLGGCLLGQWLLVQVPFWLLAIFYGLRLRHADDAGIVPDPRERQFGIRQLMVFMAIVGVVFGVGRIVLPALFQAFSLRSGADMWIIVFLAVAATAVTLPLLLAVLVEQRSLLATGLVLILIGLATLSELPLVRAIQTGSGAEMGHFISINAFTSAWILGIALLIKLNGYSLTSPSRG